MNASVKLVTALIALVVLATTGALVSSLYAWHVRGVLNSILHENIEHLMAATELELELQRQRGLVVSQLPAFDQEARLRRLEALGSDLQQQLDVLERAARDDQALALLERIRETHVQFEALRTGAMAQLREGVERPGNVEALLATYETLLDQGALLAAYNRAALDRALEREKQEVLGLGYMLLLGAVLSALLGAGLLWLLMTRLLLPLRRMAMHARAMTDDGERVATGADKEDLDSLAYYLHLLTSNAARAKDDAQVRRDELRHAQRLAAVGGAVAQVAHEIKNRVVGIGLAARSLRRRANKADQVLETADGIAGEALRLEQMMRDLMDFSRPATFDAGVHPLNEVVQAALERVRLQTPEGIELEYEPAHDTPAVAVDEKRLEQVIINLVRNAVEALEERGRITLCTRPCHEGAMLLVRDSGPGIPPDKAAHIFDPFYTTKKQGNGLGLAICSQIIQEHGGEIRLENAEDGGACLVIVFPHAK